ncbi:MAG: HEAT repeat domain-containing protein, partial [Candidatus Heimdallarchaeota archaeon]
LVEILKNKNIEWDIRFSAISALGKMNKTSSNEALTSILQDLDEDIWIQNSALFSLGELDDSRSVFILKETLRKTKSRKVRKQIKYYLELLSIMHGYENREGIPYYLYSIKEEERIEKWLSQLNSFRKNNRKKSAWNLGIKKVEEAKHKLIEILHTDRNNSVKTISALSLGRIRGKEALKALEDTINGFDKPIVKFAAAYALNNYRLNKLEDITNFTPETISKLYEDITRLELKTGITTDFKLWWEKWSGEIIGAITGAVIGAVLGFLLGRYL